MMTKTEIERLEMEGIEYLPASEAFGGANASIKIDGEYWFFETLIETKKIRGIYFDRYFLGRACKTGQKTCLAGKGKLILCK